MTRTLGAFPRVRLRRLRSTPGVRAMVRETAVGPSDLCQPLFIHDTAGDEPIRSMPGQSRLCLASLQAKAEQCYAAGVPAVALFPKVSDSLKTNDGSSAWDDQGLVPRAVRAIKQAVPELIVVTDVALDPYSSLGQDGIVLPTGEIDNDSTNEALALQAVCQARAGADIVAPSDMMDGRVGVIRDALDEHDERRTLIMSYSAKYASAFYGPFRHALDSAPAPGTDKRTYQMDPGNTDEAILEVEMDFAEGADIVMVKPGMPYLDILSRVKRHFSRPVAVYHVSGEYAMIKAAGERGWIDERRVTLEALQCFKRAGADIIFTYFALQAAEWMKEAGAA
eukprot:TRINITY_DN47833_c0_g1_i1.p1 TRINITY_DN47833_c0_g1~~TRINITY_DN47833_c0_g1_i1.p1  ORF type:complete len:337 (+),score=93.16 TRINITY_DN47833_c0_g1_i1:75-1085(+)